MADDTIDDSVAELHCLARMLGVRNSLAEKAAGKALFEVAETLCANRGTPTVEQAADAAAAATGFGPKGPMGGWRE